MKNQLTSDRVYIVIINFKTWQDTIECLESVYKLNYGDFEVIVVDNFSENESVHKIEEWAKNYNVKNAYNNPETFSEFSARSFKYAFLNNSEDFLNCKSESDFTFIKSNENKGFAAGNNIGIKYALQKNDFKYIWLLNNDTIVDVNSLRELVNQMDANAKIGILGSVLLNFYSPKTLQGIGGYYNKYTGTTKEILNGKVLNETLLNQSYKINYPIGASLFVKRDFLRDVGLMNEEYFLFFEEIDWTLRGKKYGWKCGYAAKSLIWHKGSSTINEKSKSKTKICDYFGLKSKILFTKKFYPLLIPLTYLSIAILLFNRIKKGQFDRVWPLVNISFKPNMTNSSVFNYL